MIENKLCFETTDQGFLVTQTDWNEAVAEQLALLNNVKLSENHWEIIFFIQ